MMTKDRSYLTYALGLITILLVVLGLSLILGTVMLCLGVMEVDLLHNSFIHFSVIAGKGEPSIWQNVISLMSAAIVFGILFTIRQFLKNIITDNIFVGQNVTLCHRVSILLVLAAFLEKGVLTINDYSFLNMTFIVAAILVWSLAKVLEKANAIAQENEFTI